MAKRGSKIIANHAALMWYFEETTSSSFLIELEKFLETDNGVSDVLTFINVFIFLNRGKELKFQNKLFCSFGKDTKSTFKIQNWLYRIEYL